MQEEEFFRSGDVVITRTLAGFGSTSFAISNISLIRLAYTRKLSKAAIVLIVFGVISLAIGFNQPPYDDTRNIAIGAGVLLLLVAAIVQNFWPRKEYTFTLKANSGDVHSFTIENNDFAARVKAAIEEAIAIRV